MKGAAAGVSLIEAVIVTALAALALAISYPAVDRSLDGLRLRTAAEEAGEFLISAQQYADRNREAVLLQIDPPSRRMLVTSASSNWQRNLAFREPVRFTVPANRRSVLLHPGDLLPNLAISLAARGPGRAGFQVDPLGGVLTDWRASE